MTIFDRIKMLREAANMSQQELANKIGYKTASAINKIEMGLRDINQTKIVLFAKALNTTPAYLMGWENTPQTSLPDDAIPLDSFAKFPVIGSITAGYGGQAIEEFTDDIELIPISELHGQTPDNFFVLRVKGSSMYPKILEGDKVLVKKCSSVDSGSIAVILYNGNNATLKKVKYVSGEDWVDLIPCNPEYQTKRIEGSDLEQCRVLGQVIKLIRDF